MKKVIVVMVVMLLAWSFSARPKRLIVVSLITFIVMLGGIFPAPAQAQSPGTDLKPTFISPTPGIYVNGWPAFTVSYPKEWVELPKVGPGGGFMAGLVRPDSYPSPTLSISMVLNPRPLEDWKGLLSILTNIFTDIKVLSEKPSQLKDGNPAWEVVLELVPKIDPAGRPIENPSKQDFLYLATKKDLVRVSISLSGDRGKLGEGWKNIAYSLTFQPDREKPVLVPTDVRAFLDMYCADIVSRDIRLIMAHFSDRIRHSGANKIVYEQFFRNDPFSPLQRRTISCEATVTFFEPHGDKAYIDGFMSEKAKGDTNAGKFPMSFQQIINEHGQWKWFGNQK
jgi:hypothetical protein